MPQNLKINNWRCSQTRWRNNSLQVKVTAYSGFIVHRSGTNGGSRRWKDDSIHSINFMGLEGTPTGSSSHL
jgi:hypothetical protein